MALKHINKIKRYNNEIKKMKANDALNTLCGSCNRELSRKGIMGSLILLKDYWLKGRQMERQLYFELLRHSDYNDIEEEFDETVNNLRDNLSDKLLYEYYEARLLFVLRYYDKALISYNNLLNKIVKHEYIIPYNYRLTKEEQSDYEEDYEEKIKEIKSNMLEEMSEIKRILGID